MWAEIHAVERDLNFLLNNEDQRILVNQGKIIGMILSLCNTKCNILLYL